MPRMYKVVRWFWSARALVPDVAWALLVLAAGAWGFVAAFAPHTDPCDDRRPLVVALAIEAVLLVGAVALTVARGARHRMSGSTVAWVVGGVVLVAAGGVAYTWVGLGVCWRGLTF